MDRWTHLLDWLHSEHGLRDLHVECKDIPGAGRGLYQTSSLSYNKFAPPPDVLAIPTTALLNVHTLRPHYPPDFSPNPISHKFKSKDTPAEEGGLYPLTATQLITLHLALHHPDRPEWTDSDVPPDPWAPFLRILPESFRWHHPLTWLVPDEEGVEDGMDKWRALERSLPEPTRILLKDVEKRFWEDVNVLRTVLATHERYSTTSLSRTIPLSSFLWAWLNVNTRCLSFPLNLHPPGGSNDLTLAPILDMANHSSTSTPIPHTLPAAFPTSKATLYALPAAGGGDREVTLQYGPHDDGFLLAEYGFVCRPDAEGQGNEWNEVCVDRWVGELVDQLGEEEGGRRKRLLEETAYWGKYTLHADPSPHPSHNLLTALRLLLLPCPTAKGDIDRWHDTLAGYLPSISTLNERAVRAELVRMCEEVRHEAGQALGGLAVEVGEEGEWAQAREAVRSLWRSRRSIATLVKEEVLDDVEF